MPPARYHLAKTFRRWPWAIYLALAMILGPRVALAGMDETLKAFQQSEFSFARSVSEVPFYPLGWAQDTFYPRSQFKESGGGLPAATVVENTLNFGLVLPVYIARRDLFLLGADLAWDNLQVQSGPYQDQSILRVTPVAAWLHQFGEQDTLGVFAAPIFSEELRQHQPVGTSGYGGIVMLHQFTPEWQLLYGGVYQDNFGQHIGLPYAGLLWSPTPKCSLALVFPWPNFSYVPAERWLLQVGLAPGGSSWVRRGNAYETTQSYGSWNLNAGAAYRLQGKVWLFAGVGLAALRGLKIEGGDDRVRFESQPGPVFTLALQFRP
jgi:hypothetical protein